MRFTDIIRAQSLRMVPDTICCLSVVMIIFICNFNRFLLHIFAWPTGLNKYELLLLVYSRNIVHHPWRAHHCSRCGVEPGRGWMRDLSSGNLLLLFPWPFIITQSHNLIFLKKL